MTGPTSYVTVGSAEVSIEIKRSRFLCRIERVTDEAAARTVIEETRKQYWDARHHCSAFILGPASQTQRSSDDGEPAGTAGAPMLEVLRGREVSDCVAVVTRWFGGVLLGAGGLVRAYGDSVRAGLDATTLVRRALMTRFLLTLPHTEAGRVIAALRDRDYAILTIDYAADVRVEVGVPATAEADLAPFIAAQTGGTVTPQRLGDTWVDA